MSVEKYPLDFDTLKKGDVIPIQTLERVLSVKFGSTAYSLKVMSFAGEIENNMARRGPRPTLRISKGEIHVLEDEQASECNASRFKQKLRGIVRDHTRNMSVEVAVLDEESRAKHERSIETQGRLLQAIAKERRAISLEAHQRKTPGITA